MLKQISRTSVAHARVVASTGPRMNSSRALVSIWRVKVADADPTSPIRLAAPWWFQSWVAVKFTPMAAFAYQLGSERPLQAVNQIEPLPVPDAFRVSVTAPTKPKVYCPFQLAALSELRVRLFPVPRERR